ncbi:MAG: hypothetical protein J6386_01195 [Candidatus Synoicihabitans palmerolidicus]|nr:hypothetical protein [Candidatus Synoicihabitans palmerolidicus]
MESPLPTIAIVMPVLNEEAVLPETFRRLTALFNAPSILRVACHPGRRRQY